MEMYIWKLELTKDLGLACSSATKVLVPVYVRARSEHVARGLTAFTFGIAASERPYGSQPPNAIIENCII
jgi:hypothetical protein